MFISKTTYAFGSSQSAAYASTVYESGWKKENQQQGTLTKQASKKLSIEGVAQIADNINVGSESKMSQQCILFCVWLRGNSQELPIKNKHLCSATEQWKKVVWFDESQTQWLPRGSLLHHTA